MTFELVVSSSLQDYLEAVLVLSEKNDLVRITDLAEILEISKPSATEAVRSLVSLGLLRHESYGPVELTEAGEAQALVVRHRHRMLKRFLTEVLGVPHSIAEKDACRMEHAVSQDTISRLVSFLEAEVDPADPRNNGV